MSTQMGILELLALADLAEQARIVQLLVEQVSVTPEGIQIRLKTDGLATLVADLRAAEMGRAA